MTVIVYPDKVDYVAQCLDVDVATRGETEREAADKIRDELERFIANYEFENRDPDDDPSKDTLNLQIFGILP